MIDRSLNDEEISARAEEAYLYGFPMMMGYRFLLGSFIAEGAPSFRTPINTLKSDARALDHRFKEVISPNADTPYTFAAVDLRAEPFVLSVPAVTDRYYVMQLEDLLGFNEHYVGTRATGTSAGSYLLAGPGWQGQPPAGITDVLRFETDIVFVIGRTQLLGVDDVQQLVAVQDDYEVRSLSDFTGTAAPPAAPPVDWPAWDDEASRDERFLSYVSFLLGFCQPIHEGDAALLDRMAGIGVRPGTAIDVGSLPSETRQAIRAGVESARAKMAAAIDAQPSYPTGWSNTDIFGDRAFFGGDYLKRAAGAQMGWGGNDRIEAFYPMQRRDADGDALDGSAHAYAMTWDVDPPAQAFWSVTMYDTSYDGAAGYLVENPIDRYLINSTTPGLVRGEDGSLTIAIQHERPGDDAAVANWLPAPAGPFYLVLRIYVPAPDALDGTWVPPAVTKA
jgi:hypothetical protein